MGCIINLVGQKFGKWTVIEPAKEKVGKYFAWTCECECGNIKNILGTALKRGRSKSCGKNICHSKFLDITGKKFGKLTVTKISKNRIKGEIGIECICDCGDTVLINKAALRSTSSCNKRTCKYTFKDITGNTYNKLTAIKYTHTKINDYWDFKCSCGSIVNILAHNVLKEHTKSCGCIKRKNEKLSIMRRAYEDHLHGSNKRKLKNHLSFDEYISIASCVCHYCEEVDIRINRQTGAKIRLNGIDRKNNEKFYKKENSLPCCRICNTIKLDLTYFDFLNKIRKIFSLHCKTTTNPEDNIRSDL